jgi:hypothetical protein
LHKSYFLLFHNIAQHHLNSKPHYNFALKSSSLYPNSLNLRLSLGSHLLCKSSNSSKWALNLSLYRVFLSDRIWDRMKGM